MLRGLPKVALVACGVAVLASTYCGSAVGTPSSPSAPVVKPPETSTPRITAIQVGVAANVEATLAPGATLQLWALEMYEDGNTADATNLAQWQSDNASVATVSPSGLLTAGSEGTTKVSAVREHVGTLEVRVRQPGCEDLILSPDSQIVTSGGGSCSDSGYCATFKVTAPMPNCGWSLTSDARWLDVESEPQQKGSAQVRFRIEQNQLPASRTGHIVVTAGQRRLVHAVTQEGSGCKFKVEPLERTLFLGARSFFEVLPTPQDCSWLVQEASGITLLNGGSHKGSARIEYVVNETATFWRRHIDIYEANYRWRASHVVEIPVK